MVSPVHGDYRRRQAEIPFIVLCRFPKPALTPGLNFIYVHLNRVIKKHDLDMIYITGPGHGGPGLVANAYLEGTYSEVYPNVSLDEQGMKRLFTRTACFPSPTTVCAVGTT